MKKYRLIFLLCTFSVFMNAFAQNTGPNNIDHIIFTRDGVDMSTGRYHKNLNILHVPGPGGGYTINLNYMSNPAYDQEASWVGTGWFLSPGSITRTLNGVPDDVKDARFLTCIDDADPQTTNDSHTLNFGYNHESWISPALQHIFGFNRALFGFQEKIFTDEFNQPVSFGTGPLYFKDITPEGEMGDSEIEIPGGNFVQLTDRRFKIFPYYFMDTYYCNYIPTGDGAIASPTFKDYEIHSSLNILFPNYDEFHVNTANLQATFTLKLFENGVLYGKGDEYQANEIEDHDFNIDYCIDFGIEPGEYLPNEEIPYYGITGFEEKPEFYMLDEHAGLRREEPGSYNTVNHQFEYEGLDPNDLPEHLYDQYNKTNDLNNTAGDTYNKKKATAFNIEYFLNSELTDYSTPENSNKGFIECNSLSGERNNGDEVDENGIGAYTITDDKGYSYHFSLPVYQFEWVLNDKLRDQSDNLLSYLNKYSFKKFAYSWLLTSITGPDYIDVANSSNQYGTIGEEDSGYWVKFNYGKWSDGYVWQTSINDDMPTAETQRKFFGRKQVYYLNSIETATHIAYFIKSQRNDAIGQSLNINNTYTAYQDQNTKLVDKWYRQDNDLEYTGDPNVQHDRTVTEQFTSNSVNLLKLDDIVLVNKRYIKEKHPSTDIKWEKTSEHSQNNNAVEISELINIGGVVYYTTPYEQSYVDTYSGNIMEALDANVSDLLAASSVNIHFEYDYSIRAGYEINTINSNTGKLSLKSIETLRNNENVTPKTEFSYMNTPDENWDDEGPLDLGWLGNGWGNLASIRNALGSIEEINYQELQINQELDNNVYRLLPLKYTVAKSIKVINELEENHLTQVNYKFLSPVIPHRPAIHFNRSDFISLFYLRPNPVLHFGQTEITNELNNEKISKSVHYFNTPVIEWKEANPDQVPNVLAVNASAMSRNFKIKQSFAKIGRLEGSEHYDFVNNKEQLVSQEYYQYADENYGWPFNTPVPSAGVTQEAFTSRKLKSSTYLDSGNEVTITELYDQQTVVMRVPSLLVQIIKNTNGDVSKTVSGEFDLESGSVLEVEVGDRKIKTTPADQIVAADGTPIMPELSGKYKDYNNKNLYSLAAQSEIIENGDYFSMSASLLSDTWATPYYDQTEACFKYNTTAVNGVYHGLKSYAWKGLTKSNGAYQGFYEDGLDKRFDWTLTNPEDNEQNGWVSMSENIAYDEHSNLLETVDINGNYSSAKYDQSGLLPLSSGSNSSYLAYFHSGFENFEEVGSLTFYDRQLFAPDNSGLRVNDNSSAKGNFTSIPNINAHTGEFYYYMQNSLTYSASCEKFKPGSYNLIFWVHENSAENMQANIQVVHADHSTDNILNYTCNSVSNDYPEIEGWHYIKVTVDLSNIQSDDIITVGFNGAGASSVHYIDDIRFQPVNSQVSAMVYDRKTNAVTAVLDNNNFATKYIYYPNGSLYQEYVESIRFGLSKIKEYEQHYMRDE